MIVLHCVVKEAAQAVIAGSQPMAVCHVFLNRSDVSHPCEQVMSTELILSRADENNDAGLRLIVESCLEQST
jgi:hypothetical protein